MWRTEVLRREILNQRDLERLAVLLAEQPEPTSMRRWCGHPRGASLRCLVLGELGGLLQLDDRIQALSPYAHLPRVPGRPVDAAPLFWLAAGVAAFSRRDLS